MTIPKDLNRKRASSEPPESLRGPTGAKRAKPNVAALGSQAPVPPKLDSLPTEILDLIAKEAVGPAKGLNALHATYGLTFGSRQLSQKVTLTTAVGIPLKKHQQMCQKVKFIYELTIPGIRAGSLHSHKSLYPVINYVPAYVRKNLISHLKLSFLRTEGWFLPDPNDDVGIRPKPVEVSLTKKERVEVLLYAFDNRSANHHALRFCAENFRLMTRNQLQLFVESFQIRGIGNNFDLIPPSLFQRYSRESSAVYSKLVSDLIVNRRDSCVHVPWGAGLGETVDQNLNHICTTLNSSDVEQLFKSGNYFLALRVAWLGYGPECKMKCTAEQAGWLAFRITMDDAPPERIICDAMSGYLDRLPDALQDAFFRHCTELWNESGLTGPKIDLAFLALQNVLLSMDKPGFPFRRKFIEFFSGCVEDADFCSANFMGNLLASPAFSLDDVKKHLANIDKTNYATLLDGVVTIGLKIPNDKAKALLNGVFQAVKSSQIDLWPHLLSVFPLLSVELHKDVIDVLLQAPEPRWLSSGQKLGLTSTLDVNSFGRLVKHVVNGNWDEDTKIRALGRLAPTTEQVIDVETLDAVVGLLGDASRSMTDDERSTVLAWYIMPYLDSAQRQSLETRLLSENRIWRDPLKALNLEFSPLSF